MSIDNKKVLIVDDEFPHREALHDKLVENNIAVLEAKDGVEGLEVALKEHPDLILLDILMPEMGGLDMAKKLRQDEWGKDAKIVILTNSPDIEDVQKSLESEVFDYLVKSDTKIEDVVKKVMDTLGQ